MTTVNGKSVREMETDIIKAFVNAALARNYVLSVYDGGEWVVRKSDDLDTIMAALFSTDGDRINVWTRGDVKIGWVEFIYGNSGWDVIHNNSVGAELEALLADATKLADQYADGIW